MAHKSSIFFLFAGSRGTGGGGIKLRRGTAGVGPKPRPWTPAELTDTSSSGASSLVCLLFGHNEIRLFIGS